MATAGGAGGSEDPTRLALASLTVPERRILAALAVVGRATLSDEELAGVAEVDDVAPIVDDLRRRGLVQTDEEARHSVIRTIGADIRKTGDAVEAAEGLRANFETLARGGRLTPARVLEDAEAILGLSDFLAEHEEWESVLELVQTVEASFSVAEAVTEWTALLREGWEASRVLGNTGAEVLMLRQLSAASSRAGDPAAAGRYAGQAELLRGPPPIVAPRGPGVWRIVAIVLGLLGAAAIGLGVGVLVSRDGGTAGSTTALVPVTVTLPGQTLVTAETSTLPAVTVVTTETAVLTETALLTETLATTETVVTTVFTTPTIG